MHALPNRYCLHNISELWTPEGKAAAAGAAMARLKKLRRACLYVADGRIAWVGEESALSAVNRSAAADPLEREAALAPQIDAGGRACVPGIVDSHTHFVFAGWREDEFFWRAQGVPYMEIHRRGGGILRSVEATRAATEGELIELGRTRLNRMLSLGVTTVEGKSGYGLDFDTELRQLRAMRALQSDELSAALPAEGATPQSAPRPSRRPSLRSSEGAHLPGAAPDIVPTFLGAHTIPREFSGQPRAYLAFLLDAVLPAVRAENLAPFVDIFCEKGVFELEDSRWYLERARAAGFALKLHADEVTPLGGTKLAAELSAVSADHLLKASGAHIAALAKAGTIACLLPLTAFSLRKPYTDGRRFIDAGCAVALASDLNPGSCYSQSIPLIFALAVLQMGMSIEEAITALTLNGAASLKIADRAGSLEPGKDADFLLLDAPSPAHLAYHTGMNIVAEVYKRGALVWKNGNELTKTPLGPRL